MADELDLLRDANPVRPDEGPWRDRPLDSRAERHLNQLLHSGRRRRPGRRLALSAVAAAAAVVTVLTLLLSGGGAPRAVAAPRPLVAHSSAAVPLARVAERAESEADGTSSRARRGSHLMEWALSMESGPGAAPPVTVPQERITHWNADGSGYGMTVATDPRHPGRPVIDGSGVRPRTVHDGKVVEKVIYPPGIDGATGSFWDPPPTGAAAMRAYLADWNKDADNGTAGLLDAVAEFLDTWTPGPRQSAAIAALLAGCDDLTPAGAVTDRLGRDGQAYVLRPPDGAGDEDATRRMVVLDPDSGRVLGLEQTVTKDDPEYRLKAGAVMSYTVWM